MTEMVTAPTPNPRATRMPQPRPDMRRPGPDRMILGRAGIRLPIS
jgi:hypothetical protein